MRRTLTIIIVVVGLAICIGIAGQPPADRVTTVILVRHAERAAARDAAEGAGDPELSPAGAQRAQDLAHVLADAGVNAIYVTPFARTQQTAAPLAKQEGVPVTPLAAEALDDLVARISSAHSGQTILVVGHSNTVPGIIERLGGGNVPAIAETEFDNMYVIVIGQSSAMCVRLKYGQPSRLAPSELGE